MQLDTGNNWNKYDFMVNSRKVCSKERFDVFSSFLARTVRISAAKLNSNNAIPYDTISCHTIPYLCVCFLHNFAWGIAINVIMKASMIGTIDI